MTNKACKQKDTGLPKPLGVVTLDLVGGQYGRPNTV